MSTSANLDACAEGANVAAPDRRSETRFRAMYRPCCILKSGNAYIGVVRNFSSAGAKIDFDANLEVGDEIHYFWDEHSFVKARVVWRNGRQFGVENIRTVRGGAHDFPARSVRVPCKAEAVCWVASRPQTCLVQNISIGGMRTSGLPILPVGTILTVSFCGLDFPETSVRWSTDEQAGLAFSERLSREKLAHLLLDKRIGMSQIVFDA